MCKDLGVCCVQHQVAASAMTASVTELMNSGETSVPYCSARNA